MLLGNKFLFSTKPIWESSKVVFHAESSGRTSSIEPCIYENRSIFVSNIH